MRHAFLNVEEDGITVKIMHEGKKESTYLATNNQQFVDYCDSKSITDLVCSSSLDHPREYTKKEHVVQMANAIRGNDV